MSDDSVSLVIIVACLVCSSYFSATETAFSTMNHARMKTMADKGNKSAALALKLSDNYDTLLSTILIGNNLVNILLSSLATLLFVKMLGSSTGTTASTLVTTVLVLIFGEISPKSIAKESPESFAMFSAPIIRVLMVVLTPVTWIFAQWKKLLTRLFKKDGDDRAMTDEELMTIVEEAEQDGGIDAEESTLIRSAIEFMDLESIDIYTPRVDIVSVSLDESKEEIAKIFLDTGFSRLPVYEENIDHIIGIINQKDFHNFIYNTDRSIKEIVRPVLFITPTMKIGSLLKKLQASKTHIAIILDEFGGTEGLVTIEDIVEELVGDIWDEHDQVVTEIEKISNEEYLMAGSTSIDDVFEELGIEKEVDVNTLSGWVMEVLACIPKEGDSFVSDGYKVTVVKMDERRIEKVRVLKVHSETEDENDTQNS